MRLATESTIRPAAILQTLNHAQCASRRGGFTTCLVMHIAPDGAVIAANAGHLAPYLDGRELALENGLPLGLLADAESIALQAQQFGQEDDITVLAVTRLPIAGPVSVSMAPALGT